MEVENWNSAFSVSEYARVIADTGRYACYLSFADNFGDKHTSKVHLKLLVATFCHHLQAIEWLHFIFVQMPFLDIVTMAKVLPSLRELKVYELSDTELPEEMAVSQMVETFCLVDTRFEHLELFSVDDGIESKVARCLEMLTILCPLLVYITTGLDIIASVREDVVKEPAYQVYRERLGKVGLLG